ncbi:MAG: EcsC family protein, partial [Oscillospiraceae bacterium]|nr:EcsC family protein [Oscillospiraceae bacterium]
LYSYVMQGLLTAKSADNMAVEYLNKNNGNVQKAMQAMITMQVTKCKTIGFLTGLGGFITLPVADIGLSMYVQMRMIAGIAVMNGYSLYDDAVKTMVYSILLGIELGNTIIKPICVKTADKFATNMLKKMPAKGLVKINRKLGFQFITKFGKTGMINLVKYVPFVGGVVNAVINLAETKAIANRAMKAFAN